MVWGHYFLSVSRESGIAADTITGADATYQFCGVVDSVPKIERGVEVAVESHGHTLVGDVARRERCLRNVNLRREHSCGEQTHR